MKVAAAIGATLAFVALPVLVLAHAGLVTSDPPAGGLLTTTPYTLTTTFDDELTPNGSSIVVENSSGAQVAQGTVSADDSHVQTAELPALPDGVYTVRWTAVSADDAAVERGTYTFNVGSGSSTPAPTPAPGGGTGDSSNDVLIAVGLALVIIGAIVAFVFLRRRS
jgi:LPXTG-motif cell wall-anchored protein